MNLAFVPILKKGVVFSGTKQRQRAVRSAGDLEDKNATVPSLVLGAPVK